MSDKEDKADGVMRMAVPLFAATDVWLRSLYLYQSDWKHYGITAGDYDDVGLPTKAAIVRASKRWLDGIAGDISDETFREMWVEGQLSALERPTLRLHS